MIRGSSVLVAVACTAPAGPAPRSPEAAPAAALPSAPEPAPSPAAEAPPAQTTESPRAARFVALPVSGFLEAVLFVPGGEDPRPVVVATHGAGGEPEWTCAEWAERTRGESFVLCPRGRAISKRERYGFYYPDHHALEREVMGAVAALEAAFGARAETRAMLYTGYSQGATMGALFLVAHAARFPRLVLTEGGFEGWTRGRTEAYAKGGGERVLFVCGTNGCRNACEKARALLEKAGVASRVDLVGGGGHTDGGRVGEHLDRVYDDALDPN